MTCFCNARFVGVNNKHGGLFMRKAKKAAKKKTAKRKTAAKRRPAKKKTAKRKVAKKATKKRVAKKATKKMRCGGKTKSGSRCKRFTNGKSKFCSAHKKKR